MLTRRGKLYEVELMNKTYFIVMIGYDMPKKELRDNHDLFCMNDNSVKGGFTGQNFIKCHRV